MHAGPPHPLPAHPPTAYLGGVVSNPPYIPSATMAAGLQAEVGRHEPWSALDGGAGAGMDSLQVGAYACVCVCEHVCVHARA